MDVWGPLLERQGSLRSHSPEENWLFLPHHPSVANTSSARGGTSWHFCHPCWDCLDWSSIALLHVVIAVWVSGCDRHVGAGKHCLAVVLHHLWVWQVLTASCLMWPLSFQGKGCDVNVVIRTENCTVSFICIWTSCGSLWHHRLLSLMKSERCTNL